jgi:hypothetical protein
MSGEGGRVVSCKIFLLSKWQEWWGVCEGCEVKGGGIIHPQAEFSMRIMAVAWVHTTHVFHNLHIQSEPPAYRLIDFKGNASIENVAALIESVCNVIARSL